MAELGQRVAKIRSKNAGPFWLTIDIFCGDAEVFDWLRKALPSETVASLYHVEPARLKRFEIESLNVIKFSFPRPVPQSAPDDRDQHGAQYSVLLEELDIA